MFDDLKLNSMGVAETERMEIRHPVTGEVIRDKDGNPAWIELRPKDSTEGRRVERVILNRRLTAKRQKSDDPMKSSTDDAAEVYTALTVDWYLVRGDGEPLGKACDESTKRKFYTDESLHWIHQQVDRFVQDLGNFYKG